MPKSRRRPSGTAITGCVRDITSANKANSTHADRHAKGGADPITPESIGAAPGGFGLGEVWNQAPENDANQIPATGWFVAHQNTPTGGWWIIQDISDSIVHYQFAFAKTKTSGVLGGTIAQRNKQDENNWGPWEWVNPPMDLNTEYRTTERYRGRPVYRKLVDLGEIPATKAIKEVFPFGKDYISGTYNVFSVDAHISSGSGDGAWTVTLPFFDVSGTLVTAIVFNGVRIEFYSSGSSSVAGYYGFALLKYTKRVD